MTYGEFWTVSINEEVKRHAEQKSAYEQWRVAYLELHPEYGPVPNVRHEYRFDWRGSFLSVQNIGDEWRDLVKEQADPYVRLASAVDKVIMRARFDFAAWRAGMIWVDEDQWQSVKDADSDGSSSGG